MLYRNVKTGAIIEFSSKIGGKNWELISGSAPKEHAVSVPVAEVTEEPVKKTTKKTSRKTTKK